MRNILSMGVALLLASCSAQSYLEESRHIAALPFTAGYDASDEGVELNWVVNWDKTRFEIFRGSDESNVQVYASNIFQTRWMDTESVPGAEYYYSVKAYNEKGRQIGETLIQKGSRSYQDYAAMHAPTSVKADEAKFGDRISLYWFGQKQSRFRIYRSAQPLAGYGLLAETGGVSYTDTNVRPGEVWYYKIASVGKDFTVSGAARKEDTLKERYYNASDTSGAPDLERGASVKGLASDSPVGLKATSSSDAVARTGAIQIFWDWEEKADYYRVYRASSEGGAYELVAPYSRTSTNFGGGLRGVYTDRGMPSAGYMDNSVSPAAYTYPKYYYKVTAVKNNQESSLSTPVQGGAVDINDVLPGPENVSAKIRTAPVTGFDAAAEFPALNGAHYDLVITWDPLPSTVTDEYVYNICASNTVTGATNLINPMVLPKSAHSYTAPNPAFNEEYRYYVFAVNTSKANLPGAEGVFLYKSLTPKPPVFQSTSLLKRVESTNLISTNAPTHTYYRTGFGGNYAHRSVGSVSKVWITEAKVGDIELVYTPAAPDTQQSYNIYRRKKGAGTLWMIVTNVPHTGDPDDPSRLITQAISDFSFTPAQYEGSGGVTLSSFYPKWEYRITAVNNGLESAPTVLTREGQAINPADILPAPSYLSVPFHYASGTGIAFWSAGWTVQNGSPATTGLSQIIGRTGSSTETQRIFITWDPLSVAGASFDYRFRHVRSAFIALDQNIYPQPDLGIPESWYVHGGVGTSTYIKLNNETSGSAMTCLYDVIDSGIAGAFVGSYTPGSVAFAVSATNKKAAGLDGNTIGIIFDESPKDPYVSAISAPSGLTAAIEPSAYPYAVKLGWNAVSGASGYQVMVATDADISTVGGNTVTNYSRVDGASPSPTTTTTASYQYTPASEFILGNKYYFQVYTIDGGGIMGSGASVAYTHNRPYKPVLVSASTNKITYTTNMTPSTNASTWVENEYFIDGPNILDKKLRNVGSVIKVWEVTAKGGTVDLQFAYNRMTALPSHYKVYRASSLSGPWSTQFTVSVSGAAMGASSYTDIIGAPGKYYYQVAAVYNSIEGNGSDASESASGVSLDTSKLSPAPAYVSVPYHWAFGTEGYKGPINRPSSAAEGFDQIAGENGAGQHLWLAWAPVSSGSSPKYTVRAAQGMSEVPVSADIVLSDSPLTKISIDNNAGTGKTALFSSGETSRAGYRQDTAAFNVTVANTLTDALGRTVTVEGGSKGIVFYESSDPYTEDELAPTAQVTAVLKKESYVSSGVYKLDLTWAKVNGAGAYTVVRRPAGGGADTVLVTTNAHVSDPASYTYTIDASSFTLGSAYEFAVISTNLSPIKRGGSNFAEYAHYMPRPPVIRSITTNSRGESTNLADANETLTVYWGSANSKNTGKVAKRWWITLTNKGVIALTWNKATAGESFDYYKIYRTSISNRPADITSDNPAEWAAVSTLFTTPNDSVTSYRDDTMSSLTAGQRRGGGASFAYPMYYYRITAVKVAGGTEYESLPSYFTNLGTGAKGAAAGGSAIDPADVYRAPAFFNPLLSWNKGTGFGATVFAGPLSPPDFKPFKSTVAYGVNYGPGYGSAVSTGITRSTSSYPTQPFWLSWGSSPDAAAKYTLKHYFKHNGEAWPGFGFSMAYEIPPGAPVTSQSREYSHCGIYAGINYSGGKTITDFYYSNFGQNGAAFEVSAVNDAAQLEGSALIGESVGMWFQEISH